jgi:hypothetical protein
MHDGSQQVSADQSSELLDSSLLRDAESTSQFAAQAVEAAEELATIRLPPATPPPPAMKPTATARMAALPVTAHDPFPPPPRMPTMPRPSWLQALLTTTFPPPAASHGADPEVTMRARRNAAAACVGFALAFALVAMITGLRGAPDDPTISPAVAAALVVAHALIAIGAGAFSFGLLRMAERLLGE